MKEISGRTIGIDVGDNILFSDFEDDGEMWTGTGPRERRKAVQFSRPFRAPPTVFATPSMWDMDSAANVRADVSTDNVTAEGFELVFRTWGDTRVARVRMRWMAIGPVASEDDWDLY
ncbi:MAG: H-type lectin domain-containing protein [Roseovarius indicus]